MTLIEKLRWTDQAACRGKTEYFFPPEKERLTAKIRREEFALSICEKCEVVAQCRSFARENGESGIWGGETDDQRHASGFTLRDPIVGRRARSRRARERRKS